MSCKKGYCKEGLTVCCKDCIRKATGFCQAACEGTDQEECKNYHNEGQERKMRNTERKTLRWTIAMLAAVLALFGIALLQAAD